MVKGLKVKVRKLGLTFTFVEITGKKLVWVWDLFVAGKKKRNKLKIKIRGQFIRLMEILFYVMNFPENVSSIQADKKFSKSAK